MQTQRRTRRRIEPLREAREIQVRLRRDDTGHRALRGRGFAEDYRGSLCLGKLFLVLGIGEERDHTLLRVLQRRDTAYFSCGIAAHFTAQSLDDFGKRQFHLALPLALTWQVRKAP